MNRLERFLALTVLIIVGLRASAAEPLADAAADAPRPTPTDDIRDPIEWVNRGFFVFNDKLYFWVLKPAATGYRAVLPEPPRRGIRHFFANLRAPIRVANNLLQLKLKRTGTELARFGVNSTVGLLGFRDPATGWGLAAADEDLGQTFGHYGLGQGFYLVLPVLGPSSLRDGVGRFGDSFLDPVRYVAPHNDWVQPTVRACEVVNDTSLRIGVYEKAKEEHEDIYTYMRQAYASRREAAVQDRSRPVPAKEKRDAIDR